MKEQHIWEFKTLRKVTVLNKKNHLKKRLNRKKKGVKKTTMLLKTEDENVFNN